MSRCAVFWLLGVLASGLRENFEKPTMASTILDEVTSQDGRPNPRISCSPGIQYARELLVKKMKDMGLAPKGQDSKYFFTVPGTDDDECPGGISNLIAELRGSDPTLKEEYILLNAHLDGPYNQGPTAVKGNQETDNSYDDGGSVATVLSLAQYFKDHPLRRSLLLVLSDGEEGISNVQTSREWRKRFVQSSANQHRGFFRNYPIGFTAWAKNPTVDLEKVRLVMTMDPLGAPGIKNHDFVAILGTESTPGLQELMEESLEASPVEPLFVNRQYAVTSYSDADAITKDFKPICRGEDCLNGVPAVWFAQTAFGKYHGGLNANYLLPALEHGQIPGIKIPREFATFALDMRKNFDDEALSRVMVTLKKVIKHLDQKSDLSYLVYDPRVHQKIDEAQHKCGHAAVATCGFSLQDAMNNKKAYDYLTRALSSTDIVPEVAKPVQMFSAHMSSMLDRIIDAYSSAGQPSEVIPRELSQTKPGLLALLTMALDFYAKEPYRQAVH